MELSWGKITKRIAEMISAGKFLSDADRAAMPDYEIGRLAREIHSFFYDTPDGYPKPFSQNPIGSYWEGVQEVAEQLTDPARVEEIYQTMMLPLWEITAQDDRYYESRKPGWKICRHTGLALTLCSTWRRRFGPLLPARNPRH